MSSGAKWVACLEARDAESLAELRLIPGLEIATAAHVIWLRGPDWDEALGAALRKIPGLRQFEALPNGSLLPRGARVPDGRLPELRWSPLRANVPVRLPAPAPSGAGNPAPVRLSLIRTDVEMPANALLTETLAWLDWTAQAPQIRLRPLRFAAASDGRVWVEGAPVPAIPGQRFHVRDSIATPCGWTWSPALEAAALARWLSLAADDRALAAEDGRWEIIKVEQFVPATRSAARLTAQELHHE